MKRLILAVAILSLPAVANAQCRAADEQQVMTCAEGSMWETQSQACVPIVVG